MCALVALMGLPLICGTKNRVSASNFCDKKQAYSIHTKDNLFISRSSNNLKLFFPFLLFIQMLAHQDHSPGPDFQEKISNIHLAPISDVKDISGISHTSSYSWRPRYPQDISQVYLTLIHDVQDISGIYDRYPRNNADKNFKQWYISIRKSYSWVIWYIDRYDVYLLEIWANS